MRRFVELVHPDDREATERELERLKVGGESVGGCNRYRAKDGSWHWLEWSCVGSVEQERIYATARDVTDRVDAQVSTRRLGEIVESSRDAILQLHAGRRDHELEHECGAPVRLHGVGGGRDVRVGPRPSGSTRRPRRGARADGSGRSRGRQRDRAARKGGRRLQVAITVSPITEPDGRIVGAATIARDISDRKRTWRYLSAQYRATRVLADAPDLDQIGARVLPIICDSGRWTCGAYWAADEEGGRLRCEATWVAPHLRGPVLPINEGADWGRPRPLASTRSASPYGWPGSPTTLRCHGPGTRPSEA